MISQSLLHLTLEYICSCKSLASITSQLMARHTEVGLLYFLFILCDMLKLGIVPVIVSAELPCFEVFRMYLNASFEDTCLHHFCALSITDHLVTKEEPTLLL